MTNPVQQARLNRLFDMYDPTHDGYITLEDFTDHAYKLSAMRGHPHDSPATRELVDSLKAWWDQMLAADSNHDGRISREELVAWAMEMQSGYLQQAVSAGAPWPLDPWIESLYKLIDANGDNHITLQEYRDWLTAAGIAHDMDVEAAFHGFDKNRHGYLSLDEFREVSRQWWMNFDPTTPGHRWIGPG
ncbi:MAG: EF-hand domain-containing protein [Anaerolineae bacterium]